MNQTVQAMLDRRSIRKFRPDNVPSDLVDQVIEAGLYAASGMGRQDTLIVAVSNRELRDRLSNFNSALMGKGPDFDPFYGAPVILIVLADKQYPTHVYDGALTMGNLMLAAHVLGLGSCWIHRAKEEFEQTEFQNLLHELGIEGEWEGIGHCALGYPDQQPATPPRKDNRVFYVK